MLNKPGGVWSISSSQALEQVTEVLVQIQASSSTSSNALGNTEADHFLKLIFYVVTSRI